MPVRPVLQLGQGCAAILTGSAPPKMDRKPPPWQKKKESTGPAWMQQSRERLEERRVTATVDNRKRNREAQRAWREKTPGDDNVEEAASSSTSDLQEVLPSGSGSPPARSGDMKEFRHASLTPASFASARHLFMCCGRPMVVRWFMSPPTPPPFLITSLCVAWKKAAQNIPSAWAFSLSLSVFLLFGLVQHPEPPPVRSTHLFSEPGAYVFIYTHGAHLFC